MAYEEDLEEGLEGQLEGGLEEAYDEPGFTQDSSGGGSQQSQRQTRTNEQQSSGFDDGTPDSVKLQPKTADASMEPDVTTGGVGKRVTSDDTKGLAPDAQLLPGEKPVYGVPKANPNNPSPGGTAGAAKNASKAEASAAKGAATAGKAGATAGTAAKAGKGAVAGAVADKVGDQLGDNVAGKGVKAVGKVVDFGKNIALLVETFPVWGPVLLVVLIAIIIAFIIGIVIALLLLKRGDIPPKEYGLGIPGAVEKTFSNPAGIYLDIMSDTLTVKDERGRPQLLALETTAGGVVREDDLFLSDAKRLCWVRSPGDCHPMQHWDIDTKRIIPWTEDYAKYSVNMRWPYVTGVSWPTSKGKSPPPPNGLAKGRYYGGRKLIIYNPATKKAVVAGISEWGPEPAGGVCNPISSSTTHTGNPRNKAFPNACVEMAAAWRATNRSGQEAYYKVPENYTGWAIGATKPVLEAIGSSDQNDVLIVGYAKDQSIDLGPITVTESNVYTAEKYVTGGTTSSGKYLNVPGIEEGEQGDCGNASIDMVSLYYISKKGTVRPKLSELPKVMRDHLSEPSGSVGWFKTKVGDKNQDGSTYYCSSPGRLNNMNNGVPDGWVFRNVDSKDDFNAAIKSVKAGDPVVVYTKAGGWYNYKHIYVLVGWDETTKEFIINNPYPPSSRGPSGVQIHVKGGDPGINKPKQTPEHLLEFSGQGTYGHTLIIRDTYK